MTDGLSGLTGISGINAIAEADPFATPEERMGGIADPYHGQWGEQEKPYPWESSLALSGSHGPYGPENQMLGDESFFFMEAGNDGTDPAFDENMPSLTRSHGSVHNVTISGAVPSQHDAINSQISQMNNKASDLKTSKGMQLWDAPVQDHWNEIWNVESGHDDVQNAPMQTAIASGGWGTNDHTSNPVAKRNQFGWGAAHFHRRYATGSIPGNYMWLKPGGRPLFKTMAGPARPAIGSNSPFQGNDLGSAFSYDNGAILQSTPTEYIPPPSPNIQTVNPQYDSAMGTDGVELW